MFSMADGDKLPGVGGVVWGVYGAKDMVQAVQRSRRDEPVAVVGVMMDYETRNNATGANRGRLRLIVCSRYRWGVLYIYHQQLPSLPPTTDESRNRQNQRSRTTTPRPCNNSIHHRSGLAEAHHMRADRDRPHECKPRLPSNSHSTRMRCGSSRC